MKASRTGAVDRSSPPPAGLPRSFVAPSIESHQLSSGVELLTVRDANLPLLHLEWVLQAGGMLDAPRQGGRASFTASLMDEGTRAYSGPQISDRIERIGGSLTTSADWEATYASCAVMSRFLDDALELVSEVVLHPTFPEHEVERIRRLRLTDLRQRHDQPEALAADWMKSVLYAGTPYSVPLSGTARAVTGLTREDVLSFHHSALTPDHSAVVAVGDVDPELLAARLEEVLDRLEPEPVPSAPDVEISAPSRGPGLGVWIVDRPGATQTELRFGHAGPPRSHSDWPALRLLSGLLGGKFTSRLMLSLRERHGITYGVSSRFVARRGPGPFLISTAVESASAALAVREILHELTRLQAEAPPEEELRETADYLIGVLPQHFESVEQIAEQVAAIRTFELGLDYLQRYPEEVRSVRPSDILQAAQTHLHPSEAVLVAVGPAEVLRSQLEAFGPTRTVTGAPGENSA